MITVVIIAIRNDQNQLLVLENSSSTPVFVGGAIPDAPKLTDIVAKVRADTGLEVQGIHLSSTSKDRGREVHRYTAYVAGGRLHPFPTSDGLRSASWVAPTLIPKLQGASRDMLELVAAMAFTHVREPDGA